MRRVREWDGLPSLLLNSHIAEFVCVVLGYEQIRASQDEQQKGDHCGYYEHFATPFSLNHINVLKRKKRPPPTVL
jgi:hypothetical protein